VTTKRESMSKPPGQIAYETYCETTGWVSHFTVSALPEWKDQDPEIRECWTKAVEAVIASEWAQAAASVPQKWVTGMPGPDEPKLGQTQQFVVFDETAQRAERNEMANEVPQNIPTSVPSLTRGLTTDPSDPRLTHGVDAEPVGQAAAYLVLSEEEIAKGFVRPVRRSYMHRNCGVVTTMNLRIAETYARNPKFYGATYCTGCNQHLPVEQFVWDGTNEVVGS
jgi:hypothetical protein